MKGFLFWVCLCLVSALAITAFGSIGNALLKAEEADVLVTMEVPSFDAVLNKLAPLAKQVNQDTGEWKEQLALNLFKVSDAALVNFSKPMEVVVLNPQKYEIPMVISFTVSDKDKFLAGFGGEDMKLNPETKGKEIMEYIRSVPEFDQDAYMADLDAGKEINLDDYYKDVKKSFFLAFAGDKAIGTAEKDLLGMALKSLKTPEMEVKRVITGDVRGLVNVKAISAIYAEQLKGMRESFEIPAEEVEDLPFDVQAIMDSYFDLLTSLVDDTETFEFGLSVIGEGDLNLQLGLTPKAETALSEFIGSQHPASMKYLGILPSDTAIAVGWNIDFSGKLADAYTGFYEKVFLGVDESILTGEEKTQIISMMRKHMENLGKGGAFSVGFGADGMDVRGAFEIKSKAVLSESMEAGFALMERKMKSLMTEDEAKEFALKYEGKIDTYKGFDIGKMTMAFPKDEMTDEEREMMTKVFGEAFEILMGYSDNAAVMSFGPNSGESLKATIDALQKPPAESVLNSAGFKSATAGFPQDNLGVFYLSVGDLMKGIMSMMPEGQQDPNMGMMIRVVEGMRFSSYVTTKGGSLVFGTNIPVTQFVKAYAGFMMPAGGDFEEE